MLRVVVHEKGGRTQRFDFDADQFNVGREEDNHLVLDRVNVSKHHLRFRRRGGKIEVMDLDSTNGTYVNGRRVTAPRAVRRADRIYVGDYILMLEGEDPAIAPTQRQEIASTDAEGRPRTRPIAVPPATHGEAEPLPPPLPRLSDADAVDEDALEIDLVDTDGDTLGAILTSARRVSAAGAESSYLDRLADRVLQTVLINVQGLDPLKNADVSEEDRARAVSLVDDLVAAMQRDGELEEGVAVDGLKGKITRELLELGPLTDLMKDVEVREIQVVGRGAIRVVRERSGNTTTAQRTDRRFSGDRALVLACQRLARKWGFLIEGSRILEGKVDDGFAMYSVLPPSAVQTPVLSLRRNRTDANNLEALVQEGVLSSDMAEVLRVAVRACRRILVCASGSVNLDRFMGAMLAEVPDEFRVVAVSDTGRLGRPDSGWVQVRRAGDPADAIALSDALGALLRGGVDLFVSQRCRHEDAASVMDALAGASRGVIVSLWGIDSAHGLWRLAGLSTVASGAIGALTVSLARSVDLLVRVSAGVCGESMQVVELVEPRVKEGHELAHVTLFRGIKGPDGRTVFRPTGTIPSFVHQLSDVGLALPMRLFQGSTEHGGS